MENKINYSLITDIYKNINFPINVIEDKDMKKCIMMIIIKAGYWEENLNNDNKTENYIKLILELIFVKKNFFNEKFSKYNLIYKYDINIDKTILYLEFDYLGFNPIFSKFIKILLYLDNIIIKNNINEILQDISLANNTDINYLFIKNILLPFFDKNVHKYKNIENIEQFFQYYFLKNENKSMTILSPYSKEKCENIIRNIFIKRKYDIDNRIYDRYDKYKSSLLNDNKFKSFNEPKLLVLSKIDINENNILLLKFYFTFLNNKTQKILEYFDYMMNSHKIGSLYYDLNKCKMIYNLNVYTQYSDTLPPELNIKFKISYSNFSYFHLKIILSKFINFLRKIRNDSNNIKNTYENFQKIYINNNYNKNNYYSFLYKYTYENDLSQSLPEFDLDLIMNIINELMSLNNLVILLELYPRNYSYFTSYIIQYPKFILNDKITSNEFNNYKYTSINKTEIINHSFASQNFDNSLFKPKQDKKDYISIYNNELINNKNIYQDINKNIKLGLNNIANKIWYIINNDNINNNIIYSKFHFIYPYIRSSQNKTNRTNIKYYNYICKNIEQEFEEIIYKNCENKIILTNDHNGINLELNTYKDIYMKVLRKILKYFFEFDKDFIEYGNVDYFTQKFNSELNQALYCIQEVTKTFFSLKFYENDYEANNLKLYGNELQDHIYIDSLIYGDIDNNIISEIKNIILYYNTREYSDISIFNNINQVKEKMFEAKKIKEGNIYIYKLQRLFYEENLNYYISSYQIIDFSEEKKIYILFIYLLFKKYLEKCDVYKIYMDKMYYIVIIRKSFDCPELIAKHTFLNIKKLIDIICNKTRNEIINILLNIKQEFNKENIYDNIWNEIYYSTYDFEGANNINLENSINNINVEEFKDFFKNNFFLKQKKIEFLFYYLEGIKYYNNTYNNNKNYSPESYPWNIDFIRNNEFQFNINEFYNNFNKIKDD